ncbi:GGDEF/EAL domain-containing response regulator [Methylophaga lonarensis]|uniref:GGDEF/EAL domain-containing response regulator n=1 Tax=Methylophaga lonarensis TaxID=999151 RepID=UPI003D2B9ED8
MNYFKSTLSDEIKFRVLYLGNDHNFENLVMSLLGEKLCHYFIADDCEQAILLFKAHPIDVVIAEFYYLKGMPECTINKLRSIDPNVTVILLNENHEIICSPLDLPCLAKNQCPLKPLNLENLLSTIISGHKDIYDQNLTALSATAFSHSSLAMTITNHANQIIAVNPAFTEITGYQVTEVIGQNPSILSSGRHDKSFYQKMWKTISHEKKWSGEIWNKRKNGELFLEWITINVITNNDGEITHYCSVFADITERKAAEERIHKLTYHDPLTELPNRRAFLERLEQNIANAKRHQKLLAVLFLDLDNFKDINDTLGHDVGDAVIKETSFRLKSCIREDDLVARLGGDEFVICLTELNHSADASVVAQKILDLMASPFGFDDERFILTFSIGISIFPSNGESVLELLKQADQAMYCAKFSGRNRYSFFDESMQQAALAKKELVRELRSSIDSEYFSIQFQPIINLLTGDIEKAEALLRWTHPKLGEISPAKFIPVAEDIGLISELGDWVFRTCAHQVKAWQEKYHKNFQISVNISPKQFQDASFDLESWVSFLSDIELTKASIALEITEGVMMNEGAITDQRLAMFRGAGIEVSLDDFGTGYSSLAYLKKLDVDYLKIDRTFIQNIHINQDDLTMCEAIIVMAHKLKIKVVAEGVENEQQCLMLQSIGCDYAQGYFFSRPLTVQSFDYLLQPKH